MSLLKIYQGRALRAALQEIISPVQVDYMTPDQPEPDLLGALADLKTLTPHLLTRVKQDSTLEVDRLVVQGENSRDLIFVGAPLGLELAALVSAIVVAGRNDSGLSPETRETLADLPAPVHLEVFTTPT
jgi:alkyl hydroperoxide reductase subunit AhpF